MTKFTVELVKYDTLKTKKRKRKDLVVDAQTKASVIEKLERIHKGDKVDVIHEIIWGEIKEEVSTPSEKFEGRIKFFDPEKGFGFIKPKLDMDDLFFHESALGGFEIYDDDLVEFEIGEGPKGPVAIHIVGININ